MINLLPDNEKKAINREYKLRRTTMVLAGLFCVVLMALLLLLPSYVLALYKAKAPNVDVAKAAAVNQADEEKSKAQIDTAKALLKVLQPQPNIILPSQIISYLDKDKTANNSVSDIDYARSDDGSLITVSVRGVAKSREGLSTFTESLRHEPGVTTVDVPVSNFAKDSNIQFNFTITAKIN